jgi:hypothetical protein
VQCIINVFRACVGLPPDNYMLLEHRVPSLISALKKRPPAAQLSAGASPARSDAEPYVVSAEDTASETSEKKSRS